MQKYVRWGLGLAAGMVAGIAVYKFMNREQGETFAATPPFAEAAESSEN